MMLHLSFAFAVAFLSVSVISSAFNGPRATSAVDDEVSFAHGWTPRPTSGSVARNIKRQNAPNVLTELWAPDNICGYYQKSNSLLWFCPTTATCVFFQETNTIGYMGCGQSGTVYISITACVDYSQYLPSSSLYDQDENIIKCTNPATPYCNTANFPELHDFNYVYNFDFKLLLREFDFKLFFLVFDFKLLFFDISLFELSSSGTNAKSHRQKPHGYHCRKCGWSSGRRSGGSCGNGCLSEETETKTK
ncbi:hypothetical protein KCU93_g8953, partial [Aureobasidium melanogenum]